MDKIEISVEEYKHLKLCESFIDDNGYFWALEAFKDVVEHVEAVEKMVNKKLN